MRRKNLIDEIQLKNSFLCVGLDTDPEKIPSFLHEYDDPVFEFNKRIIDCTHDLCVAYKLNIAFYESLGVPGWKSLEKTIDYIPDSQFLIADAKRGDIGNTSERYAKTFFETYSFDAITVAPYMGSDSVKPFYGIEDKWVIILALTSNPGSKDFQFLEMEDGGDKLYEKVLDISSQWGNSEDTMYVVGATHPEQLRGIRNKVPNHFLLIPGVGKQGGSLEEVVSSALVSGECGLLVNSSRGIIYASGDRDFEKEARREALKLQNKMSELLVDCF
ncbi:orotidine-5'-phosphate decarboxylase [Membranihabitans maritimus]|uniref:orotidine-5'-phosphate decarboxylase n=1 Tax=Membranihabitans maritimus TaxID=2904244 RepID=UPI001F01A0E0|nr:orotidine-5'-phosphate decarboxylase [Membranihabitans maritimus]